MAAGALFRFLRDLCLGVATRESGFGKPCHRPVFVGDEIHFGDTPRQHFTLYTAHFTNPTKRAKRVCFA